MRGDSMSYEVPLFNIITVNDTGTRRNIGYHKGKFDGTYFSVLKEMKDFDINNNTIEICVEGTTLISTLKICY